MECKRNRKIARIKIGVKNLGLDEDTERGMKEAITGKSSLTQMNMHELDAVLDQVAHYLGERGAPAYPDRPRMLSTRGGVNAGKLGIMTKIEALLAEADRPWAYGHAIGERMFQVKRLEWLRPDQLRGVLVALIKDAKRHGRA